MGIPNLPQDFATEWRRVKELALAAFTAANQDKILIGKIDWFAGPPSNVPDGWLVCDGSAVSRTDHADLFGQIGTRWGAGDGSTTFNVPDLRDRTLIGSEGSLTVGDTGGSTSTSSDGGHDHSIALSGTHTHSNTRTNFQGTHSHGISSAGGHDHGDTDSAGGHSHTTGNPTLLAQVASGGIGVGSSDHGHSIGTNGSHAHGISNAGGHDHGGTGSDGSHDHFMPDTGDSGSHGHGQATGTEADHSHTHEPPYAAVLPIIRAGG